MDLRNTGVLITGASRGLGAALAEQLAQKGARVVLVARDRARVESLAEKIRSQGFEAHALSGDLGDKNAIHPLAGAAAALIGPIDILIHNASTLGAVPLKSLLETECEEFEQVLEVNLLGPFRLSKLVAGSMALRGKGLVVHISSDASIEAYPNWGAYGVSKAALDHLARIWAQELHGSGVNFLSIDPGEMNTKMHADAVPDADPNTLSDPSVVAGWITRWIQRSDHVSAGARLIASTAEQLS
jgi:NAD(P)-dependent dehydrogenase (short-subunit alcohol dehydrogenase family)